MRVFAALLVISASGFLAACSSGAGSGEVSGVGVATSPPAAAHPVIGKLKTHDRSIVLMSSHDGLRVTVEDASGAVIARDVEVERLRGVDPVAYELCRSSLAMSEGPYLEARGPYLDAR
jgi:hypothetical protein